MTDSRSCEFEARRSDYSRSGIYWRQLDLRKCRSICFTTYRQAVGRRADLWFEGIVCAKFIIVRRGDVGLFSFGVSEGKDGMNEGVVVVK
jgi:hypothetical protein